MNDTQAQAIKLDRSRLASIAAPFAAVAVSFLLGGVLLLLTGHNPFHAYGGLLRGAFGNANALAGTLMTTTPLIFSALSFLIAYKAGLFNAGNEGQLLVGAFAAALVGAAFGGLPAALYLPLVLVAGFAAGALWGIVPAVWKLFWGINELVTTLMMNYVASLLTDYLTLNVFRSPTVQTGTNTQTIAMAPAARLGSIFPPYHVTMALPLGVAAALIVFWFLYYTVGGYQLRMSGQQPGFARYGGISVRQTRLFAMVLSGGLAGLGGAVQVAGIFHAYVTPFTVGLGFNGVLIALLVRGNALLVPPVAFFFGALQSGALNMQIFTNVSRYIIGVLTALFILLASVQNAGLSTRGLFRTGD
jgi:general nucleoside transport system permease protein